MKLTIFVALSLTAMAAWAEAPLLAKKNVQTPPAGAGAAGDGVRYASVSLKPNRTNPGPMSFNAFANGGYEIVNDSLHRLITLAYPGASVDLASEPPWVRTERYDVTATSPLTGVATGEQRQAMMRALIEERFNFKAHLVGHQEPAYDLVRVRADGSLGPGLRPSPADCTAANQMSTRDATGALERLRRLPEDAAPADCTARTRGNVMEGDLQMSSLALSLTLSTGQRVVDKTGLTGLYRIRLVAAGQSRTATDDAPDIFDALQDQLGLKLEESERTAYTLVIDRVERLRAD